MALADEDIFQWTNGAATFTVRDVARGHRPAMHDGFSGLDRAAGKPAGQVHHLEMRQYNSRGFPTGAV